MPKPFQHPNQLNAPNRPETCSSGGEREERRPFRNVEVRKLGPGRRHNQPRQTTGN